MYCYARPTHEYLGLDGASSFQEVIFAKVNAPGVARRELGRRTWHRENVVVGTATDPYQQAESRYRLTRGILEAFRDARNPVSITTKSPMVLRDLDVLRDLARHVEVTIHFTVTTLDRDLWRKLEPTTALPDKRLEAMQVLHDNGIRTGVFLSPVLPGITDSLSQLEAVVAAAAAHGANFLFSQVLRLGPGISDYYLPFLEREFPGLLPEYRALYKGNSAAGAYCDRIGDLVRDLKRAHSIADTMPPMKALPAPTAQLPLFPLERVTHRSRAAGAG